MSNPYKVSLALTAPVATAIAASQSLGAAGNLTINGSLASGGVATLKTAAAPARRVGITSAGNDSGLTWTITGTDRYGNPQSEALAGGNAAAVQSVNDYATVTRIRGSAATAATVTAGTTAVGSAEWRVQDMFRETFNVGVSVTVSGTVSYNVEQTWDDPNAALFGSILPSSNQPPVAVAAAPFNGLSTAQSASLTVPFFAIRLTIYAGTGTATMTVIQSGIAS